MYYIYCFYQLYSKKSAPQPTCTVLLIETIEKSPSVAQTFLYFFLPSFKKKLIGVLHLYHNLSVIVSNSQSNTNQNFTFLWVKFSLQNRLIADYNSISLTPLTCNRTCYNHLFIDEVRFQPNNNSRIKHKHCLRNISSQQFIDSITSTNNLNMKVRIEII